MLQLKLPSSSEKENVKEIFLVHNQKYGINVQASSDYKFSFVYAALAAPGGANDIAALRFKSCH